MQRRKLGTLPRCQMLVHARAPKQKVWQAPWRRPGGLPIVHFEVETAFNKALLVFYFGSG